MDTQLFPPLLGAIPSTPPSLDSPQLCSDCSPRGEALGSKAPFQDCTKKRAPINLSYSGSGPDMFGLVSSILEEPSKPEPVTEWNSLSRLFPPLWAPDLGSNGELSGLSPQHCMESKDLSQLLGTQSCYPEHLPKSHHVEMLHRGLEDLHLLESWLSPSGPCSQPGNSSVPNNPPAPHGGFAFPSADCDQHSCSCDHRRLNGDYPKICSSFSPFSPQHRMEDSTSSQKGSWETERARGKALRNDAQEQPKYSPDLSSQPVDEAWDKVFQDNHLFSERPDNFTAAHRWQSSALPSLCFCNHPLKENPFFGGTNRKPEAAQVQNGHCSLPLGDAFKNHDCKIQIKPKECSHRLPEYDLSVKSLLQHGSCSSLHGCAWLGGKMASLAAAADVVYGKEVVTSPQLPSEVSTMSSGSPTHQASYYSQILPVLPPRKDGRLPVPNGVSSVNNSSAAGFSSENQRQRKPLGQPHHESLAHKEGQYQKSLIHLSSDWLPQHNALSEDPDQYHRFPNSQPPATSAKDDRRSRRNGMPRSGCTPPDHQHFSMLPKKHRQNGGSMSDFINPSFLPSFPLISDFQQDPGFPPWNPHLFSAANTFSFPPSPLPFSELVDLFHYDDFKPWNPFLSDLLCGEISAPSFAFPTPLNKCRPPRNRGGPASELHVQLEECYEQWRALEKERKKTEAELARSFPGQHISSSNTTAVPGLPANPSRLDRLIAAQLREQARVHTLTGKMERLGGSPVHRNIARALQQHRAAIHLAQTRREEEIVNAANPQRQGAPRYHHEKDVLALAAAVGELAASTRRARTALWCALQMALPKHSWSAPRNQEAVERPLQAEFCPPNTSTQANSDGEHENKASKQEKAEEAVRILG